MQTATAARPRAHATAPLTPRSSPLSTLLPAPLLLPAIMPRQALACRPRARALARQLLRPSPALLTSHTDRVLPLSGSAPSLPPSPARVFNAPLPSPNGQRPQPACARCTKRRRRAIKAEAWLPSPFCPLRAPLLPLPCSSLLLPLTPLTPQHRPTLQNPRSIPSSPPPAKCAAAGDPNPRRPVISRSHLLPLWSPLLPSNPFPSSPFAQKLPPTRSRISGRRRSSGTATAAVPVAGDDGVSPKLARRPPLVSFLWSPDPLAQPLAGGELAEPADHRLPCLSLLPPPSVADDGAPPASSVKPV